MFCTQCGNELVPGASFCGECGARVSDRAKKKTEEENIIPVQPEAVPDENQETETENFEVITAETPEKTEYVPEEPVFETETEITGGQQDECREHEIAEDDYVNPEDESATADNENTVDFEEDVYAGEEKTDEPSETVQDFEPEDIKPDVSEPETVSPAAETETVSAVEEKTDSYPGSPEIDAVKEAKTIYGFESAGYEEPKKKKKLSWLAIVSIVLGVLLVICVTALVLVIKGISDDNREKSFSYVADDPGQPGNNPAPKEKEDSEDVFVSDSEEFRLYDVYDDFINSDSFELGETDPGDIVYVGKPVFDHIGSCYMVFVLSNDKQTVKNISIYLSELDLTLTSGSASIDLSNVSIRQDYNTELQVSDSMEANFGKSSFRDFSFSDNFASAKGTLDFTFTYYPTAAYSAPSPIDTDLGESTVTLVPVRICE